MQNPNGLSLVTKDSFLRALTCLTQGWLSLNSSGDEPDQGTLFRMQEGRDIHNRARRLHPDGVFAGDAEQTAEALKNAATAVIFEGSFLVDGYAARADLLVRDADGFRLREVKSSLHNEGEVKDEHIDDMAYTTMVLQRAGIRLTKIGLVLISRDWRLGMPDSDLFVTSDHTAAVLGRANEFSAQWDPIRTSIQGKQSPVAKAIFECGKCGYFETRCIGTGLQDPVFDLPRLSLKKYGELAQSGILTISGIPANFDLTENQSRVRDAVASGKPVVDGPKLKKLLDGVRWPAAYLDFETVKTVIPLWPGIAPHEQVVTQYSLHACGGLGQVPTAKSFLADASRDCRRELTERLIADTASAGSVVVYSGFEKTTISGLAKLFPDLAPALGELSKRLFDLERAFREAYYHPGFRGSTSIKATLPVLIPEMSYASLEIGSGDDAIAAFAKMARGECSRGEENQTRAALLEYCGQDTMAMVKLHEVLGKFAS